MITSTRSQPDERGTVSLEDSIDCWAIIYDRGPLKPCVWLEWGVQISLTLSSRPEQIIANPMICGVEGTSC
jgi:hypothetical protein